MINITVWDSDKIFIEEIKQIIKYLQKNEKISVRIKMITDDANQILLDVKKINNTIDDVNIYLLESELKSKLDGIELAKKIRKLSPLSYVIFASKKDYSFWTCKYSIKASEYFIKPIGTQEFRNVIMAIEEDYRNIIEKIKKFNSGSISLTSEYKKLTVNLDDIILVEYRRPKTVLYTKLGECYTYYTMKEIEGKINEVDESKNLIRSHSGYIVNLKHVKEVNFPKSFIKLKNDMDVPISRSRKIKLKERCKEIIDYNKNN